MAALSVMEPSGDLLGSQVRGGLDVEAWLDALPVGGIGAGAVLAAVALLYFRGSIVAGPWVDRLEKLWEARLAAAERRETDALAAWETERKRNDVLAAQVVEMLEQGRTMDRFIRSMPLHRSGGPTE